MKRFTIFAAVAGIALAACGGVSGNKADPGPFPENYEQQVKAHLRQSLKDPYSIQSLSIARPIRLSLWTGLVYSGSVETWASCTSYNAKNSFGAYVGLSNFTYYFRDGQLFNMREGC